MKNLKNSCFIILAFLFSLSFTRFTFAGEWVSEGSKWKYKENDTFVTNDWREIDNSIYYFQSDGTMATELVKIGKYYHMFNENGRPYARTQDFVFNKIYYSIGSRGKVLDLETVFNETDYFKFIVDLREKRAKEAAIEATRFASPDAVPEGFVPVAESETRELTEQEKRLLAAEEYKKIEAQKAEEAKIAEKYRILSKEYRDALALAATQGTDEASATMSLMNAMTSQLTAIKTGITASVQNTMVTDPSKLNLDATIEDFEKTLKEYRTEIDTACRSIRARLGLDNTRFVLMKDKFTQILDKEVQSLRTMIMSLIG